MFSLQFTQSSYDTGWSCQDLDIIIIESKEVMTAVTLAVGDTTGHLVHL